MKRFSDIKTLTRFRWFMHHENFFKKSSLRVRITLEPHKSIVNLQRQSPKTQYGSSGVSSEDVGISFPSSALTGVDAVAEGRDKEYIDIVVTPHFFHDRLSCLSRRKCQARTAAAPMLHAACAITLSTVRLDKDKIDASIGEVLWLFSVRQ